jgi:ketosteroid isomerase-like protein
MKRNVSISVVLATLFMGIGSLAWAANAAGSPPTASCSNENSNASDSIAALHREWILVGWEKNEGDGPFDFRARFGKFYDFASADVVFYDDFDPQHRVARSAMGYGDIWTQPFTQLRSAHHSVVNGPEVIAGADLATSTLEFAAALTAADGKVTGIRTRSTLVWRCSESRWRIVREHNSSRVVTTPEVRALLQAAPPRTAP